MNKYHLLSFIQKYSLGGKIESVAWETNEVLKTRFMSEDKNLIGSVEYNSLDVKDLGGTKLGLYKTSPLVKILNVLEDEVDMKLTSSGEKPIAIKFEDSKMKVSYALADLVVIQTVPALKYEPKEYDVILKIDKDFSERFIKVSNAMVDVENFTVNATSKKTNLTFGATDVNVNRTILDVEVEKTSDIEKQVFDSVLFKEILNANKGVESKFNISKEGIAKIIFKTDEYTATYYLVAKSSN